jgi:hypothetical protein
MANQEEQQKINDSTLRELAAIVETHNRNVRDLEVKSLREQLDNLKWELGMKVKTLKVREASNQILTVKYHQIHRSCKAQIDSVDKQVKELKAFAAENTKNKNEVDMQFRQAKQNWEKKEEEFNDEIENLGIYIADLHATLERNGIINDQYVEESDESDSDGFEVNWNVYLYRREEYESDTQFDDDDDDIEPQNRYQRPHIAPSHCNLLQHIPKAIFEQLDDEEESIEDDNQQYESNQEVGQVMQNDNMEPEVEAQSVHDDQRTEEQIESADQSIDVKADKSVSSDEVSMADSHTEDNDKPQEQNWCDIMEAESSELDQTTQSTEPVLNDDSSSCESTSIIEEQSQPASSESSTETRDKVLESEKPIEAEVPQKIKLDPFVHGYVEREKSKKRRQKKPKSKPKYSSLASFGGY